MQEKPSFASQTTNFSQASRKFKGTSTSYVGVLVAIKYDTLRQQCDFSVLPLNIHYSFQVVKLPEKQDIVRRFRKPPAGSLHHFGFYKKVTNMWLLIVGKQLKIEPCWRLQEAINWMKPVKTNNYTWTRLLFTW